MRVGITGTLMLLGALAAAAGAREPILRTLDLKVGQAQTVTLADGAKATVKLLGVKETRDPLRGALRRADVTLEVNGERVTLQSANYALPVSAGGVQVDCAATGGLVAGSSKRNVWALAADARVRLWPAGSPWIRPGTFLYPVPQRWFASDTQMANEPVFVDGGEIPARKSIYYHYGLDIGGSEAQAPVLAATDGVVVSVGGKVAQGAPQPPVAPRYDVIYLRDDRGWYYRYSHLHSIDKSVTLGQPVKMGQRLGLLGKEGGSGGWSHLHFDISAIQPGGAYGIVEGYAFFWQAAHGKSGTKLQAVARPHCLTWAGKEVTLDASRSWSAKGPGHIKSYQWTLTGGADARGVTARRTYDKPGTYSEILKVTDADGRESHDFAVVQVIDEKAPGQIPPAIHPVYWPTTGIRPGDAVTFKVRTFRVGKTEGRETWDFGDGSPKVAVQSDGNAVMHAKDGYAVTTHAYKKPGVYLVSVSRTNARGETATGRLSVKVE